VDRGGKMSVIKKLNTARRREEIKNTVEKEGKANVVELAEFYGASQATIRTDLKELERTNALKRTHGGAISIGSAYKSYYDTTLNERMNINKQEKIKIARACASLIKDGDVIFIDSGTTSNYMARELSQLNNLTVLTNAILVAQELFYNPSIKVILFGGDIEFGNQFTYGNDTIAQLNRYRANKYLLAIDGISVEHGITTYHHQEVEISRLMMERADRVIAAADDSKIGKEGFSFIASLSSIDTLITNSHESNKKTLEDIRNHGIEVIEV